MIEPMLQSIPDPFDSYGPPKPEDQIFSILAPLSIFNASASPSPRAGTAEIDPVSNIASPNDISWSSDHDDMDSAASQWADVHTPTSSPPLSAKSTATVTINHATSPPSSSRRASYPTSGNSPLSPGRSSGGMRKADSKLRKSLSAIHEAVSSESSSVSRSSFESKSRLPSVASDNHERESSSDTLRQPNSEANTSINGSRNAFADDPIWGSHETSSSMTLHGEENRKDSSTNGVGRVDNHKRDPELSGSGLGQG